MEGAIPRANGSGIVVTPDSLSRIYSPCEKYALGGWVRSRYGKTAQERKREMSSAGGVRESDYRVTVGSEDECGGNPPRSIPTERWNSGATCGHLIRAVWDVAGYQDVGPACA